MRGLPVADDAGALHADALVAATSEDHRNLVACQIARRVFFVQRTIAVVQDPGNEEVFRRLGVDATVSVTAILVRMVAQETVPNGIRDSDASEDTQAAVIGRLLEE